jgi:cytochrome b pre-mRNA-processing protein 3
MNLHSQRHLPSLWPNGHHPPVPAPAKPLPGRIAPDTPMPLLFMPASVNQLSAGCNTALGFASHFTKANQGKLMILGFFRKNNANRAIVERQYGILTTAARQKAFYRSANVPDTVMGRFEMLSVVMILYFRRCGKAPAVAKDISQEIVDAFFQDLDHSMRELGIGDQGVPKRMKKLASMFYGRADSYGKALDAHDVDALAAAMKRNFHPQTPDSTLSMLRLANYMMEADLALDAIADAALERGEAELLRMDDGEGR